MGYWENRQADLMYGYMQSAEDAAAEIARAYEAAAAYTRQEIEKIFQRFTGQYGLSDAAARRILRNVRDLRSLDSLRSAVEASGENADELLAEMNSGAYAARMIRWEDVQASLDDVMQRVYGYEQQVSSECYRGVAQQSYLDTIAGVQEQVGFSFSFAEINPEEIDTVMNTPFLGRNYSERIWNNTQAVADSVREEMLVGVMTGKSQRDMAQDITERFGVGASNARRLVRTEAAFVSGEAQAKAYEECGADKYEFVATLDLRTSEVCQKLDGQIFELKDKQVGVNYPPMHPYCRSTTIIHIDDEVEQGLEGRRIARNPVTGQNEYVDANTTYEEWEADQREQYGDEAIDQARRDLRRPPEPVRSERNDRAQYDRYVERLGVETVGSFEDFRRLKHAYPHPTTNIPTGITKAQEWEYLNPWERMQLQYRYTGIHDRLLEKYPEYRQFANAAEIPAEYSAQALSLFGSEEEMKGSALYRYTNPDYCGGINSAAASNDTSSPAYRDVLEIDRYLGQMSLPYDTIVYRGTIRERVGGLPELIDGVPIGEWSGRPITTAANTSTSLLRDTSYPGEVEMIILIPEGQKGVGYLDEISYNYHENNRSEYEALLHRNSRYSILEAQSFNGKFFVVAQWLGFDEV